MHYVMSDLHGQYFAFEAMLKKIGFTSDDFLYIAGDVVDRGPNPVALLMRILYSPNMVLLIGNHEHMMLDVMKKQANGSAWAMNGCETTLDDLARFPKTITDDLFARLERCPLQLSHITVGAREFCISHTGPSPKYTGDIPVYSEAEPEAVKSLTQSRLNADEPQKAYRELLQAGLPKETVVLFGHTPVQLLSYGKTEPDTGQGMITKADGVPFYDLDCGCAGGFTPGCLCLETMQEYYLLEESMS